MCTRLFSPLPQEPGYEANINSVLHKNFKTFLRYNGRNWKQKPLDLKKLLTQAQNFKPLKHRHQKHFEAEGAMVVWYYRYMHKFFSLIRLSLWPWWSKPFAMVWYHHRSYTGRLCKRIGNCSHEQSVCIHVEWWLHTPCYSWGWWICQVLHVYVHMYVYSYWSCNVRRATKSKLWDRRKLPASFVSYAVLLTLPNKFTLAFFVVIVVDIVLLFCFFFATFIEISSIYKTLGKCFVGLYLKWPQLQKGGKGKATVWAHQNKYYWGLHCLLWASKPLEGPNISYFGFLDYMYMSCTRTNVCGTVAMKWGASELQIRQPHQKRDSLTWVSLVQTWNYFCLGVLDR